MTVIVWTLKILGWFFSPFGWAKAYVQIRRANVLERLGMEAMQKGLKFTGKQSADGLSVSFGQQSEKQ